MFNKAIRLSELELSSGNKFVDRHVQTKVITIGHPHLLMQGPNY